MDLKIARRMIPHIATHTGCYLVQANRIYKYCYDKKVLLYVDMVTKETSKLKIFLKEVLVRNCIFRNYFSKNFGIGHVSISNDKHLIAIYDCLYYRDLNESKGKMQRLTQYKELKISNPLFGGIAVVPQKNHFYFGEYINSSKDIRIIKFDCAQQQLSVVYTFAMGRIKHVHGIFYDHYRERLWVTTGDTNEQSHIFYTDDEFKTLEVLGGGDQSWRAVSIIPLKDCIVWGTDAGKDANASDINKVYKYVFKSMHRYELAEVGNPVYHSCTTNDGKIILGINFEPGRKQATEESSSIWSSDFNDLNIWNMHSSHFYADARLKSCSIYGYVYLPKGEQPSDCILYSVLNASTRDFATYKLII